MVLTHEIHSLVEYDDDSAWDSLVESSRESNPFLLSSFLKSINKNHTKRIMVKNGVPILGASNYQIQSKTTPADEDFRLYQGIFFPKNKKASYSDDNERLSAMSNFIQILDNNGENAVISLHPSISDIRAVDWFYFQRQDRRLTPKYKVHYTGVIDTSDYLTFEEYKRSIRKARIDEYKKSQFNKIAVENNSEEVDVFMKLYKMTFERQSVSLPDRVLYQAEGIIRGLMKSGSGKLNIAYSKNGQPVSGIFILTDEKTDVYLFGATDPTYRKLFGSTRLILEAIQRTFDERKTQFDMCGMNSPKRGEYKSSFNARVTPYFEIQLTANAKLNLSDKHDFEN